VEKIWVYFERISRRGTPATDSLETLLRASVSQAQRVVKFFLRLWDASDFITKSAHFHLQTQLKDLDKCLLFSTL
jgi:hypothetical protein